MIKIDIYICIYCFVTCSSQLIHKRNHITIYTISRDLRFYKIGFKALKKTIQSANLQKRIKHNNSD